MIISDKSVPKPNFWDSDFIKDFETSHPKEKISTVIWSEDASTIINQINFAIENETEIVLSDMLPDELPERILNKEYKFFVDKFFYTPPHFQNNFEIKDSLYGCGNLVLLVTDKEKDNNLNKSLELVKAQLVKESILIQKTVDELYNGKSESFLLNTNFKKIILDTTEPNAQHYLTLIAACKNIEITFLKKAALSISRIFGSGLDLFPSCHSDGENSLRQKIGNLFFESKNNITLIDTKLLKKICSPYSFEKFLNITEDDKFLKFCNNIPKKTIDDRLWINPWYNFLVDESGTKKIHLGRFKRRQANILIGISINDKKSIEKFSNSVDKFIDEYLRSFLFCLKSGAWMEEFRLMILNFQNYSTNVFLN